MDTKHLPKSPIAPSFGPLFTCSPIVYDLKKPPYFSSSPIQKDDIQVHLYHTAAGSTPYA